MQNIFSFVDTVSQMQNIYERDKTPKSSSIMFTHPLQETRAHSLWRLQEILQILKKDPTLRQQEVNQMKLDFSEKTESDSDGL